MTKDPPRPTPSELEILSVLWEGVARGVGSNPSALGRDRGEEAMTAPALFSGHFFSALGWALFHFLWQGTLVAGVLASLGLGLAKRPPVRYALACAALAAM